MPSQTVYRIAAVPGDGIGVDVTEAARKVLDALASAVGTFSFQWDTFDWNSHHYHETGEYMPSDWEGQLRSHDAIFFGAVGWPDVPDHISLWQMILPIRQQMNQYVNIRPVRILKGIVAPLAQCQKRPADLDWVIVRENSEGEYAGQGGITHGCTKNSIGTETAIFTHVGIERVMRFAFEMAKSRPRRKLTMVTKSNAQRHGMLLWDEVFHKIAKEYDGTVAYDQMLVDAMTARMVNRPESLDTIVATNLHGDIISDLAAALAGSIGIAPSSNLDPTRSCPSMFEPIHGSAPDIAGKGIANPIGALWSAAEMVGWLGKGDLDAVVAKFMAAIENTTVDRKTRTTDIDGSATTQEVTDAVCRQIYQIFGEP